MNVERRNVEIFFGEMGSGKSYSASRCAISGGKEFLEGDDLVPPEMAQRVLEFKPLTRAMVSHFVGTLTDEIVHRAVRSKNGLVVAQALYFDEDRQEIECALASVGHSVTWYWVRPSLFRNVRQLLKRKRGWRWVLYWLVNKPFFQRPAHKHRVLRR